ncbi:phage tail protein [Sodalis sp. RH19]|uniref:phage tail-collar fiber domain-containing protein n=1 Tax=Sodalis sp. RH19 TaxID=3394334 RepID=UPI0039B53398
MTIKFYALLTHQGTAKLANATALGARLEITHLAVGDGGGTRPIPDPAQTKLINQKRRAPLNSLSIDAANTNQIIAEQVIPENVGGFWIREMGLYDADDDLIAVANCPETYKPQLQEGSGRTQVVRMILIVSHAQAVTLKIDPSVILATKDYVRAQIDHTGSFLVKKLREQATSLQDKMLHAAANLSDIPDKARARRNLQLGALAERDRLTPQDIGAISLDELVGIPLPWPSRTAPSGWLKCNGAKFNKKEYPVLASIYPSGKLPDLRGEFIRGWDDGRGIDDKRSPLSFQPDAIRNITGTQCLVVAYNGASTGAFFHTGKNANEGIYDDGSPINDAPGVGNSIVGRSTGEKIYFDASRVVPTADENRPRNIAYNYIVRAA